jgi:hypothetical protein
LLVLLDTEVEKEAADVMGDEDDDDRDVQESHAEIH